MDDGFALAFGSIYQGGCFYDGTNSVPAVFKTTNNGASWSRYNMTTDRGKIYSITVHPSSSNTVYAAGYYTTSTNKVALFKTTSGGTSWSDIGASFTASEARSIVIDPNDNNRIYVGTNQGVYYSTDSGTNWTVPSLNKNVSCIVCEAATALKLYMGTTDGVYQSFDGAVTWTQMNDGLINKDVQCMDLDAVNGVLYVGTDGGGVFRNPVGTGVNDDEDAIVPREITLQQNYPNPFNMETEIVYKIPGDGMVRLAIYNLQGQLIRTLVDAHQASGRKTVTWDGRDENGREVSSGVYVCRVKMDGLMDMKKMILQK
jgi:hypothetical protein